MRTLLLVPMLLVACQKADGDGTDASTSSSESTSTTDSTTGVPTAETGTDSTTSPTACEYPVGAADPMAEGEVLPPYRWADARHLDGRTASLELERVPCNTDDDIDWSPHDVLVFISIPAW